MALRGVDSVDPRKYYGDILVLLKSELNSLEQGGYGRSVTGKAASIFQDSPTCLNVNSIREHPCAECLLTYFVPPEHRSERIPCHRIPLNEAGETVKTLGQGDHQTELEEVVKKWLRTAIKRLEDGKARESYDPGVGGENGSEPC